MNAKTVLSAAAMLVAASALALDFTWLTSAGSNNSWNNTSVWRVDGSVPDRTPNQAEDSAFISYEGNNLSQTAYGIYFPDTGYYNADAAHELEFGSLACTIGLHPLLMMNTTTDRYSGFGQTISVSDPDEFGGFWTSVSGRGKLVLKATALHTPFVKYFDTWGYMAIEVPDAGTAAEVGSLVRPGALRKTGAGKLTVGNAAGADSRIYVDDGTLVLKGVAATSLEPKLPGDSVLHLDATRIAASDMAEEAYGVGKTRMTVSAWRDCDGGSVYAVVPATPRTGEGFTGLARAPYLAAEKSSTGLQLLDFGLPMTCATEDAPSNCCFQLNKDVVAKEIFYVARNTVPADDTAAGGGSLLGAYWDPGLMGGGRLAVFGFSAADAAMRADITINGCPGSNRKVFPTRFNGEDLGSLSVVSIKLPSALSMNTIGTVRFMVNQTGGWHVGEILVYNRDLTDDERAEAVRFLMKKWHRDYVDKDVGELVVHADTAVIDVPDGRVARVGTISAHGCGRIVKDGAGTLLVDGIAQTNVLVEVRAGTIERVGSEIPTNAPASSPMLWLDATKTTSFVCDGGGSDTSKIVRWNDCRGAGAYYAEIPDADAGTIYHVSDRTAGHFPKILTGQTPTGLDAVSFGYASNGDSSWLWLQPRGQVDSYAAFVVYRVNAEPRDHNYCIGSSNTELVRGDGQTVNLASSHPNARTLRWALNGRPIDPWFSDFGGTFSTLDWRVQSYSGSLDKIRGDLLAKLTVDVDAYDGNIDIAEVILYDRPLTLEEVRETEAYLMAKWLGMPHPEVSPQIGGYAFADDVLALVGNPVPGTTNVIPLVSGSNGSLLSVGSGAVVVSGTDGAVATNSVTVAEGSLTMAYPRGEVDVDDAGCALHFDASDLSSFTFDVVDNGDGSSTTNVLVWNSRNSANLSLRSDKYMARARSAAKVMANPTFAAAAMPNGKVVPVVDFGSRNAADAAGMTFYIGSQADQFSYLKEIFFVCADKRAFGTDGADDYGDFASSTWSSGAAYIRWAACGLLSRYAAGFDSNKNMVSVDGEQKVNTYVMPRGFHVLSYRPVESGSFSSICADRDANAGGGQVAEVLAFNEVLADERREEIIASLKRKWFQRADPSAAIRSIALKDGASFGAGSDMNVSTEAVAVDGAGSIACAGLEIADAGSLSFAVSANGTVSALDVSGSMAFGGALNVSFVLDDFRALQPGVYTLLSASSLSDVDFSDWTIANESLLARRNIRFFQSGNDVKMEVSELGLRMIIR